MDGIPIHGPLVYDSYLYISTWPARGAVSGYKNCVNAVSSLWKLRLATYARSHGDWHDYKRKPASKSSWRWSRQPIMWLFFGRWWAAIHLELNKVKKLFTASCVYCHYKNLPVSLLPSSNDQLWAHYRQPYSYSWRYGYQHKEVVLIMLGDTGFHPFKGKVSKRFTDSVCMEYACLPDVRIRQSLLRSVPLHDIIDFPMLTRQGKSTWAPTTHTWAVSRLSKHVYLLRLIRYRQTMTSYVGTRSHYHDSECNG